MLHYRQLLDRCGLWGDTFKDAFRWAHEADPTAQLCISDYDLIDGAPDNRADQMVGLVEGLLAEGVSPGWGCD